MKHAVAMAVVAALGLLRAGGADARPGTTYVVNGTGEPATLNSANCTGTSCPTLRDAVNTAQAGDTVTFASALDNQTIKLSLSYNLSGLDSSFGPTAFFLSGATLVIDGSTHNVTLARDTAQAPFRLFSVDSNSSLTLRGLTLRDGLAQGGSSNGGGGALGAGGAIFNQGGLALEACTFVDNTAHGGSGGIAALTGSSAGGAGVGADATTLDGAGPNGGLSGSPPQNGGFGGGGGATTDNSNPGGNGGFGGGGGKGNTITAAGGNGGFGGGGGGDAFTSGSGGFAAGKGGGDTDHVPAGGGGAGMGGALFNDAGSVTVTNVTFYGNQAIGGNSSYAGVAAAGGNGSGYGGAIFNYAGSVALSFVTFGNNPTATGSGGDGGTADVGALYSYGDASCSNGGNVCTDGSASAQMVNSIVAHSAAATLDLKIDSSAGPSSSTGTTNVITSLSYQNSFGSSWVVGDPKLGSLSPQTHAPRLLPIPSNSPAVDAAGACADAKAQPVATDERLIARPQFNACDIGAYESTNDYIFANSYE